MVTHYEVLGVDPDATESEIRAAYSAAIWPARARSDAARERALREALTVLCGTDSRTTYDESLDPPEAVDAVDAPAPAPEAAAVSASGPQGWSQPPAPARGRRARRVLLILLLGLLVAAVGAALGWLAMTQRAPGLTVGGCVRLDADTGTAVDCRDGLASAKIVAITADADACEDRQPTCASTTAASRACARSSLRPASGSD